ncbi:transmembrane 4 L6 family member 20 [Erinaceus europaeus]|uniref:Transmembrane 4 L6 family member 20 n=1 Tax=Erinaceus europaeus TaxID=9365 RepID=A0A1S2ZJ60_ERIEU|nr:transmembrane 4 L6 family member 20 [Erinaceus europaeus]
MTCCEGWTSCNGISLLVLILAGVILNCIPLVVKLVDGDEYSKDPISCFEWWFPGIIGAGLMAIPATTMALSARKRACCNNRVGMFLSSILNVITIIGAVYCMLVSLIALLQGPLICNSHINGAANCEFSLGNLSSFDPESFDLQWFFNETCTPFTGSNNDISNNITAGQGKILNWDSDAEDNRYKMVHLSVYLGLLLVGIFEVLFGLSQILIGFLGCLCGVSKRRNRYV